MMSTKASDQALQDEEEKPFCQALEIEDALNELDDRRRGRSPEPLWKVSARYWTLASLAVVLTVTCPGETSLWTVSGKKELNPELLAELIVISSLTLIGFFLLQGSDPGYLTSDIVDGLEDGLSLMGYDNAEDEEEAVEEPKDRITRRSASLGGSSSTQQTTDPLANSSNNSNSSDVVENIKVDEDGIYRSTRRKPCRTCQFAPPLRAHHCKICDRCVATFDHHCEFVGTCIGERNHCRFWWFLLAQELSFLCFSSIVGSSKLGLFALFREFSFGSVQVVLSKMYLYPLTGVAMVMLISHTVFLLSNSTTFECGKGHHIEYLKGTKVNDMPFSKGLIENLRIFCCARDAACDCMTGTTKWSPMMWRPPGKIIRDSEDWWEHPWQNKYWNCC